MIEAISNKSMSLSSLFFYKEFIMGKRLTLVEVKKRLYKINKNIEILSEDYITTRHKLKCKCLIDKHVWYVTWDSLSQGYGCPVCGGTIVHDGNKLSIVRPDLLKYLVNINDGDIYSYSSSKRISVMCPICGKHKINKMLIYKLSESGFSCDYCSDGISIPEKFTINLLKQLEINLKSQKVFNWSNNKRYDFYFEINGERYILETHGGQHYYESKRGRSLQDEQNNDNLKYNLAIKNGIKPDNYIVIDCRKSELEWLKENCIKSLKNIFDLSSVDWLKIWGDCQSSLVVNVWEEHLNGASVNEINKSLKLSKITIRRYLKRGKDIGYFDINTQQNTNFKGEKTKQNETLFRARN